MNAQESEDLKDIYNAAKQCKHEPHKPKDQILAEWINQFVKLYEHSEAQAARIAELEASNGACEAESWEATDIVGELKARVAELEEQCGDEGMCHSKRSLISKVNELDDKLRWRDCKTEPPKQIGYYLIRWNPKSHRIAFFSSSVDEPWSVGLNDQPDAWRPIE